MGRNQIYSLPGGILFHLLPHIATYVMSCFSLSSGRSSSDDEIFRGTSPKRSTSTLHQPRRFGYISRKRKTTNYRKSRLDNIKSRLFGRRAAKPPILREVSDAEGQDFSDRDRSYDYDYEIPGSPLRLGERQNYPSPTAPPAIPLAVTPPASQPIPYSFPQTQCLTCDGKRQFRLQDLKAATVEDEYGVSRFKDETGILFYPHLRFTTGNRPLSTITSSTIRRRSKQMKKMVMLLIGEEEETKSSESQAALLCQYLSDNPDVAKLVQEKFSEKDKAAITAEDALPLLVKLTHSRNGVEKLRRGINDLAPPGKGKIFEAREQFRELTKRYEMGAEYVTETVYVEDDDKIVAVPVVTMTNIKSVLEKYGERLMNRMEISSRTYNSLLLRIGLDKGAADTKLSLSFANVDSDQSPFNQLVVGAYTGPDSYKYLKKTLSTILETIKSMKSVKIGDEKIPILLFLVGDNKSLSALIGHIGQSCTHPCQICDIDQLTLRKGLDLGNCAYRTERDPPGKGVNNTPLVTVSHDRRVPPILHCFTGPASTLLVLILEDCAYVDRKLYKKEPILKKELPSEYEKKAPRPSGMISQKDYEKKKKLAKDFIEKGDKKVAKKKSTPKEGKPGACDSEWCCQKVGVKAPVKMLSSVGKCGICDQSYHYLCNGILDADVNVADFVCASCRFGEDLTCKDLFTGAREDLTKAYELAKAVTEQSNKTGFVAYLNEFMKKHHIERQLYYGGILTGNDAHRLVKNIEEALKMFLTFTHQDKAQEKIVRDRGELYLTIGEALYSLNSSSKNQYLTPTEMVVLKNHAGKFKDAIKEVPGFHFTVKAHHLTEHFVPFAEKWGTLGKFSESYIEHGHVFWNQQSLNVGNRSMGGYRLKFIIESVNVRSLILFENKCEPDDEFADNGNQ